MCGTCGCAEGGRGPGPVRSAEELRRRIPVEREILAANAGRAEALRERLAREGVEGIGLLGAPGSGKTALLEAVLPRLGGGDAVVEGDCATERDAHRIRVLGIPAAQVETGSLCHLDAELVERALAGLDLGGCRRLWVENVGNLVCPAPFDCGERRRILVLSTAEGEEKPEKYPAAVAACDLVVLSKVDLEEVLGFDRERFEASLRRVRPDVPLLPVSARSGAGLSELRRWVLAGGAG